VIDEIRARKYQKDAAEELGVGESTLQRRFRHFYPGGEAWSTAGFGRRAGQKFAERQQQHVEKLALHLELERRIDEVHEDWKAGRAMRHTVLLLNIAGLTVSRFRNWLHTREGGEIFWRHRLNCPNIGAHLDWFINYNM
jgi:transposase